MSEKDLPNVVTIKLKRRKFESGNPWWEVDCPGGGATAPTFGGALDAASDILHSSFDAFSDPQ